MNEAYQASDLANQFSFIALRAGKREAHLTAMIQHNAARDLHLAAGNLNSYEGHAKAASLHYRAAGF